MTAKAINGISMREFARREQCSPTVVRRKIESGHLATLPGGKINPALVGTAWRPANVDAAPPAPGPRKTETPEEAAARAVADNITAFSWADT